MTIIGHLVIFFIAWLLTFFIVLPWGRTGHHDGGEGGLPVRAKGRKLLITTGIASVIWVIFWAVEAFHLISVS